MRQFGGARELVFLNAHGAVVVLGKVGRDLRRYGGGVRVGDGGPGPRGGVVGKSLIGLEALELLETRGVTERADASALEGVTLSSGKGEGNGGAITDNERTANGDGVDADGGAVVVDVGATGPAETTMPYVGSRSTVDSSSTKFRPVLRRSSLTARLTSLW